MTYQYQVLAESDTAGLKDLLRVFGEAFGEPETYQAAVPDENYLRSLLASPTFVTLVARDGQAVVGGLTAYILPKYEQVRKELYIYDLAVLELHRRRGVATGLINRLKQVASERGVDVMFVQADHGDEPAIKLYESLGHKENVYHFDISVHEK